MDKVEYRIKELRLQGKGYKAIAKQLGISKDRVRYNCEKLGLRGFLAIPNNKDVENNYKENFNRFYAGKFKYVSGYENNIKPINIECLICGHILKRNASALRCKKNIVCDCCFELKRERKKLLKIIMRIYKNEIREINKKEREERNRKIIKKCVECGKEFKTTKKRKVCCSKECARKRANNHKDRRLKNCTDVDWGITLTKLIKRDKNKCHICGGRCNNKDYVVDDKGYFIVGPDYPSIDHLVPISKGGQHIWDNVKLAHCYCNTIKSNSEVYEGLNNQLVLVI